MSKEEIRVQMLSDIRLIKLARNKRVNMVRYSAALTRYMLVYGINIFIGESFMLLIPFQYFSQIECVSCICRIFCL